MLKLKLELVIIPRRGNMMLYTGMRVFDKRSYLSTYTAIVNGCLGRHSKRSFFLRGVVLKPTSSDGETRVGITPDDWSIELSKLTSKVDNIKPVGEDEFRFLGRLLQERTEHEDNDAWEEICHPFFWPSAEGDLHLFLVPRIRQLMGFTARDLEYWVFMQNYGSHLPIFP